MIAARCCAAALGLVCSGGLVASVIAQPVAPVAAPARAEQNVNYKDYERPTVQRQSHGGAATAAKMNPQDDLDYLDIPAFLRRLAD